MFHPYQVLEDNPGRIRYHLSVSQRWIRRYFNIGLPIFVLGLGNYALSFWEKDFPWWYIPGLVTVILFSVVLAFQKVVMEVEMDRLGINIVLKNIFGKTQHSYLWQDITDIEQELQQGTRGARVFYRLILKSSQKIAFAVFPTPFQIPDEKLDMFSARVQAISSKTIKTV